MTGIRVDVDGRSLLFGDDRTIAIGRTPDADVVLTGPSTSRAHAELRHSSRGWSLVDLGTLHGTFVDGRRVDQVVILGPMDIRFGRESDGSRVLFEPDDPDDLLATRVANAPVPAPNAPDDATLVVRLEGSNHRFTDGVVRIGRRTDLELVSSDPTVSRLHARLQVESGVWRFQDVSSSGTYLDGQRVRSIPVDRALTLRLGDPSTGPEISLSPTSALAGPAPQAVTRAAQGSVPAGDLPGPPAAPAPSAPVGPTRSRRRLILVVLLALVLVAGVTTSLVAALRSGDVEGPDRPGVGPTASPPEGPSSSETSPSDDPTGTTSSGLEEAKAATVLLTATTRDFDGDRVEYQGSGSIITPDGLIMTNAHVAAPEASGQEQLYGDNDLQDPNFLLVALTSPGDAPAEESYRARPIAVDGYVDVAILRIFANADGSPLATAPLVLPTVPIGQAGQLTTGDQITVLGYPGISDSRSVTVTRGIVSTFVPDRVLDSDRAEIDTDARIAPGNSGGIAIDDAGAVIGIPFATRIDPDVGALSGRVRPIDFALPVIEAASEGRPYDSPYF